MTDDTAYTPPKVWTWDKENGGKFASINRPIAGRTHDKELTVGRHPFQLYSLATPNGQKVTIMFEELLAAGHSAAEYDANCCHRRSTGVNSVFLALPDQSGNSGESPLRACDPDPK